MAEQCKVSRGHLLKVYLYLRIVAGIAYSVSDMLRAEPPPVGARFSIRVQTTPEDDADSCTMCPDLFPGGKAARAWR